MNVSERKVFLSTMYQIIGKVVISFLGIISTAYLTRYLGKNVFGEYSLVFTFIGLVTIFPDFGLATLLTREIAAKKEDNQYLAYIFTIRFFLLVITSIISIVIAFILPYSMNVKTGILIGLIGAIYLSLSGILWSFSQAKFEFKKVVISQVVTAFITCTLIVFGVYIHANFIYFIAASVIGNIFGYYLSKKFIRTTKLFLVNLTYFKKILQHSWPIGLGVIISVAYFKVDSLLLSFYYDPANHPDLGLYSVAYKIFEVVTVFAGYFTQVLFPLFSKTFHESIFKYQVQKYFTYTLFLALISGILLYLFAPLMVRVLGGQDYSAAISSVKILSVGASATILAGLFVSIAVAGNKQMLLLKFACIALILNILLNLIYLPHYSFIAASWITDITQIFVLLADGIVAYIVIRKHSKT